MSENMTAPQEPGPMHRIKEISGILASAYRRLRGDYDDIEKTTGIQMGDSEGEPDPPNEEKALCLS